MSVLYKAFQSALPDKNGNKLFYPRVVLKGNVGTDQIAQEIAEYSSLTKGDTKNVIENLITVMSTHLQASESVTLDGLGNFRLVMRSQGKGVATKEEVSASQATITVHFTPAITRNLDRTVATRALVTGVKCTLIDSLSASTATDSTGSGDSSSSEEDPFG